MNSRFFKVLSAEEVPCLYNNVSALATRVSHGFMSSNNGDTYTGVTPPAPATPIHPTTDTLRSFREFYLVWREGRLNILPPFAHNNKVNLLDGLL